MEQADDEDDLLKSCICDFPACTFRTKTKYHLNGHKIMHGTTLKRRKPFPCNFENCQHRAVRKEYWEHHVWAKHTSGRTKNSQCPLWITKKFHTNIDMKIHLRSHKKEKQFATCGNSKPCISPPWEITISKYMRSSSSTSVNMLAANTLQERKVITSGIFLSHSSDPLAKSPFPCNFAQCNYHGITQIELKGHVNRCHNPDRSVGFECPMCFKSSV